MGRISKSVVVIFSLNILKNQLMSFPFSSTALMRITISILYKESRGNPENFLFLIRLDGNTEMERCICRQCKIVSEFTVYYSAVFIATLVFQILPCRPCRFSYCHQTGRGNIQSTIFQIRMMTSVDQSVFTLIILF